MLSQWVQPHLIWKCPTAYNYLSTSQVLIPIFYFFNYEYFGFLENSLVFRKSKHWYCAHYSQAVSEGDCVAWSSLGVATRIGRRPHSWPRTFCVVIRREMAQGQGWGMWGSITNELTHVKYLEHYLAPSKYWAPWLLSMLAVPHLQVLRSLWPVKRPRKERNWQ